MSRKLTFHEAAAIFPLLEGDDLAALAADIKEHGLQTPIELFEAKVIDGRNRATACRLAGVEPRTVAIQTDDPVAYVLSANLHRRHLNETQRGLVAQRAREFYDKQAKERQREGGKHGGEKAGRGRPATDRDVDSGSQPYRKPPSREQAGAAVGVSGITVDRVRDALKTAEPELVAAMERGEVKANTAKRIATLPPDEQRAVLRGERPAPRSNGEPTEPETGKLQGVGVLRANEAIDALMRIPKKDPLRKRGFQIVSDWIKANR